MKISIIKNNYSISYGQTNPDFYQSRISQKVAPVDTVEIIENVMNDIEPYSPVNERNKLFFKIGKIFENAESFENAKAFYKKVKDNTPPNELNRHKNIDFDIKRVNQKELEKYTKRWEA